MGIAVKIVGTEVKIVGRVLVACAGLVVVKDWGFGVWILSGGRRVWCGGVREEGREMGMGRCNQEPGYICDSLYKNKG